MRIVRMVPPAVATLTSTGRAAAAGLPAIV
jgi:hypothetical protein